jgi:hypothetical protein
VDIDKALGSARLDAVGVGSVLQDREYIKAAIRSLSRPALLQVVQLMEDQRAARRVGPASVVPLPEMGAAELQREIAWRLGVLPPDDAKSVADLVRRLAPRTV